MCRKMGISVFVYVGIYFGDAPGSRILRAAATWDLQFASGLLKENNKTTEKQPNDTQIEKS